ncbi:MAG: helix-turn-helix domain-containing protein [Prevotella sp.]
MGWAETPSASDTAMLAMKGPDSPYSEWTNLSVSELMNKGSRYLHDSRYDYALLCFTIVVERPEDNISSSDRKLQVKAYTNLANLYVYVFYDFEKAMGYIESAQKLAIETHQEDALPLVYTTRAAIMLLTNFYHDPERVDTQAFDIYKKAYVAAKRQHNWLCVILDVINLSSNALSSKKLSVAMPVVEDYLSLQIPDTFPSQRATRQMCLGIKAVSEKHYDKAINLFKSALALCDEKTYKNYPLMVYSNIQYTYEITGRYEKALREARKIADILSKGNSTDALCVTYYDISRYERKLGNKSSADSAYMNYLQLKDKFLYSSKLLDAEQQRFIRDLQTAHNQVELLSMKKKNLTLLSVSLTAILLLIVLFLVISYRSYRRMKVKNKELYQSNLALLKADEQRRLITSQQQTEPEQPTKYSSSTITEDEKQQLASRILRVMDNVDEICSEGFTINRLAQLTGSNRNYCSQVMNEILHKSFSVMLAECRIKEACRRFNNAGQQYTIEAVAQSVGYKSRSSFVTAFKRFTGLPPSEYQRLAQKK